MKSKNFIRLKNIISNFKNTRVMVLGDLILDEFVWGKVERISPEAPVPIVWVDRESFMPGGASNVANNIATLGAKVDLAGIIGNDAKGGILKSELEQRGVITDGIITDRARPTVSKSRVIAHKQQIVRIDREKVNPVSRKALNRLISYIREKISGIDILIIEDYGKGVISSALLRAIIPLARRHKKVIAVDPKEDHFRSYKGVTVITPNAEEASRATGIKLQNKKSIEAAGRALLKRLRCELALITLGEKGMALFKEKRRPVYIPTIAQDVYDVSGAGDTVIGTFSLALASGAGDIEAAHIANCAAGIVVGKVGIAVVERDELTERVRKELEK